MFASSRRPEEPIHFYGCPQCRAREGIRIAPISNQEYEGSALATGRVHRSSGMGWGARGKQVTDGWDTSIDVAKYVVLIVPL